MRLLADVDTGIDDALALCWLAAREDVDLVGVSTTSGNTTARQAAENSLAVLEICGVDGVEVCVGTPAPLVVPASTTPETHGDHGLGNATLPQTRGSLSSRGFLDLWLDELRAHPGETTLLVTGPLTNLAAALRAEPGLPELLARVVIMGGSFDHPGNTTPTAEWNSWVDPHAAAEAYAAWEGEPADRLPIVCSLGVTERIVITPERLAELIAGAGPDPQRPQVLALLADALEFYFDFHAEYGYGRLAQVHDLFAAMVALDAVPWPAMTTWVGVETTSELTRGTTVRDARNLWRRTPNARVVTDTDPDRVWELFRDDLTRLVNRPAPPGNSARGA